jgi:long-subunit acyl-CoA synthetase (AMP-forming)
MLMGVTVVPIYDTLGEEATQFAFDQTDMEVCFISAKHLDRIIKVKQDG